MPSSLSADIKDRVVGCIMGVFIGDALGVGVHWQYNLDVLQRERGFVMDYLDPLPGTFHSGTPDAPSPRGQLRAGQLEQQGVLDKQLLESLAQYGELNQTDFLERFERIILREPTMDGTRQGGSYGWTDKSICDIYKARILQGKPWEECAPPRSDTPDSIVRAALIGALYFQTPNDLAVQVQTHARYATGDSSVQSHSVAFASMIAGILDADLPLDETLSTVLYNQAGLSLPYSTIYSSKDYDPSYGMYTEPDSLLWFGNIAKGISKNRQDLPAPAHLGVLLYGQFCAFFASVPSAYYCAARFPESFEDAILCSVNGGGQNTMRSSLVGALLGARVGLQGIPKRFIEGLEDHKYLMELANSVAEAAILNRNEQDAWKWPSDDTPLKGLPSGKMEKDKESKERITKTANMVALPSSFDLSGYPQNVNAVFALFSAFVAGIAFAVILPTLIQKTRGFRRPMNHRYERIN